MKIYTISLPNVTPIKAITAQATYGIGFLTAFVGGFCSLFGIPNNMFTEKLKKAEALAMDDLNKSARAVGADGVMDVRCQIDGLSFLVCGTAYKVSPEEKVKPKSESAKHMIKATQNATQTKVEAKKEVESKGLPCPECGEELEFMGWSDNELKRQQICPLCGKEILFNK